MEKVRLRIGLKTGSWLFPNAAVFIVYVKPAQAADLMEWSERGRELLRIAGQGIIADLLVCEIS